MSAQDELTAIVCEAVQQLTQIRKAEFLLNTALALIEDGQSGEEVERYLDFYLRTPGLPVEDVEKALLARGVNPRKMEAQVIPLVVLDPLNMLVPSQSPGKESRFSNDPACQRIPPEIWEQIAAHIPRYHLRTWLFVSRFHRDIASRRIFHTINIFFGGAEKDQDDVHRGIDIFAHANNDPIFASRVKSLRLHWVCEQAWHRVGDISNVIIRIVEMSLPAFKTLRNFEWSGYPWIGEQNLRVDVVQALLNTHKNLHGLSVKGSYVSLVGIPAFENLRKFSVLMSYLNDSAAKEVFTVLDRNQSTLKHLILGGNNPCKLVFESGTIDNLTHLDLVGMRISNFMLTRIAHAHNLRSVTLRGLFVNVNSASAVFASDRIIDGSHSVLPHLEAFRLILGHGNEPAFEYHSVIHFLQKREKIRRLNLGSCPWDMIQGILPGLKNLRVLAVRIHHLSRGAIESLVESIPTHMVAIRLSVELPDKPLNEYAPWFAHFSTLSFLHLRKYHHTQKPYQMSENDFRLQIGECLRSIATAVPSLDFVAWNDELCAVVAPHDDVEIKEIPTHNSLEYGWSSGVDIGEDAVWLEQKDVSIDY